MSEDTLWQKISDKIKSQIPSNHFRTFFGQSQVSSINENKIIISSSSAFIKGEMIRRYDSLIKDTVESVLGQKVEVFYEIDSSKFTKNKIEEEEEFEFGVSPFRAHDQSGLNPKYTIENFVVGLTNNLAYAASQAVIQNPGLSYNPLYIYGPSGVGKTHLMQAIGHTLLKKNLSLKVVYAPSERFMNDFVESIQQKSSNRFRQKYRSCDILLIDDIQFISGKDSTQEEFFHTFNDLDGRNCQLVFTSDRPPHEIEKLEQRLKSRFQGGLMVDIQLPDFDTRVAILKAKLQEKNETLPEDCLRLIAEAVPSNTRELEGKLILILQNLKLKGEPPTLENIRQILGKTPTENLSSAPDSKKVLETIGSHFNLRLSDLTGPRRQKELVLPRQIAMFILHLDCHIPQEKVGEILGGRDHTTVLHGVEKIREKSLRDREVQRLLIEVRQNLAL